MGRMGKMGRKEVGGNGSGGKRKSCVGCREGKCVCGRGRRGRREEEEGRCVAAAAAAAVEVEGEGGEGNGGEVEGGGEARAVFGGEREVSVVGGAMASLPPVVRAVGAGALVALSAGGGATAVATYASSTLPRWLASAAGAAVGGGAGALLASRLDHLRRDAALNLLHNGVLARLDAGMLLDAEGAPVALPGAGVELEDDCARYYDAYLCAMLPEDDTPLTGLEVESLRCFGAFLGLEEQVCAGVHMDVGQRILRMRIESDPTGPRGVESNALRRFQKLVFVSQLLFGEQKARFLLPWRRRCNFTDAQVKVAMREVGSKLFSRAIDEAEKKNRFFFVDGAAMHALEAERVALNLEGGTAANLVRGAARRAGEAALRPAIETLRSRGSVARGKGAVVDDALSSLIDLDARGTRLAAESAEVKALGVGPMSIGTGSGGVFDTASGASDLRDVLKHAVTKVFEDGELSDADASRIDAIVRILGTRREDADMLMLEETRRVYEASLRAAVADGSLEAAPSKAAFLQTLCERLRFDPSAALAYNNKLYEKKLKTLVKAGEITDADDADLVKMRVLLCIASEAADRARREVCARPYVNALRNVLSKTDSFSEYALNTVRAAQKKMRLPADLALELMTPVVKKEMLAFVTRSRSIKDQGESAAELQKLVYFNQEVVTPIVNDLVPPPEEKEEAAKKVAELIKEAAEKEEEAASAAAASSSGDTSTSGDSLRSAAEGQGFTETTSSAAEGQGFSDTTPSAAEGQGFAETSSSAAAAPTPEEIEKKKKEEEERKKRDYDTASMESARTTIEKKLAENDGKFIAMDISERYRLAKEGGLYTDPRAANVQSDVRRAQRAVSLQTELTLVDRKELYKKYFMRTIEGEYVDGPMGLKVLVQRDSTVTMQMLGQFSDLMGLSPLEVSAVQREFSEQAFIASAERILGSNSKIDAAATGQLKEVQTQLAVSDEDAAKMLAKVQSKRAAGALRQRVAQGNVTLETIREMKASGMDVERSVGAPARLTLFKKAVESALSAGTGEADASALRDGLAGDLALEIEKASRELDSIASNKKKDAMVQAVSFLRQKRRSDGVKALNNLIACSRILPDPVDWAMRGEKEDLFVMYAQEVEDAAKRESLASLFSLSADDAAALLDVAKSTAAAAGAGPEAEKALF